MDKMKQIKMKIANQLITVLALIKMKVNHIHKKIKQFNYNKSKIQVTIIYLINLSVYNYNEKKICIIIHDFIRF